MPAKDKCIICGQPAVGRFCRAHILEALEHSRQLYYTDRPAGMQEVNTANIQAGILLPPLSPNVPRTEYRARDESTFTYKQIGEDQ